MAFEDINCLSDLIHEPLDIALQQYAERRRSRVSWTVKESNKIIKLAGLGQSPIGRLLRNSIIRIKGPANVVGWKKLLNTFEE